MRYFHVFLVTLALICSVYAQRRGRNGDAAGRAHLRREIFNDYDRVNIPDDVSVKFGLTILTLNVNEEKGTLETDAWLQYRWRDSRLAWDNVTNGIDLLRVSPDELWKPDITLYNSANLKDMMNCWDSNPILYATGEVLWVPPCQLITHCNFTLEKFPYNEQHCIIKLGSWTYDSDLMDFQLFGGIESAVVSDYGSTEWKIIGNTATRNVKHYPCCAEPYTDITYNLTIQRIDNDFQTCERPNSNNEL